MLLIQGFGRCTPFDTSRVSTAVRRALFLGGRTPGNEPVSDDTQLPARTEEVVREVVTQLRRHEYMRGGGGGAHVVSSAELHDIVEACLFARGEYTGAKSYIVARVKRELE